MLRIALMFVLLLFFSLNHVLIARETDFSKFFIEEGYVIDKDYNYNDNGFVFIAPINEGHIRETSFKLGRYDYIFLKKLESQYCIEKAKECLDKWGMSYEIDRNDICVEPKNRTKIEKKLFATGSLDIIWIYSGSMNPIKYKWSEASLHIATQAEIEALREDGLFEVEASVCMKDDVAVITIKPLNPSAYKFSAESKKRIEKYFSKTIKYFDVDKVAIIFSEHTDLSDTKK